MIVVSSKLGKLVTRAVRSPTSSICGNRRDSSLFFLRSFGIRWQRRFLSHATITKALSPNLQPNQQARFGSLSSKRTTDKKTQAETERRRVTRAFSATISSRQQRGFSVLLLFLVHWVANCFRLVVVGRLALPVSFWPWMRGSSATQRWRVSHNGPGDVTGTDRRQHGDVTSCS